MSPRRILPALHQLVRVLVERDVSPMVYDDGGIRTLRFNNGVMQSAMRLAEPYALDLGYTRAMMAFLLFLPEPRDILVVGLGGGSLSKFCHRELPDARVTTLEINPAVIALRDRFHIPGDGPRFRIVECDAAEYIARPDTSADVILLDGYDEQGLPDTLCSAAFYSRCRQRLAPHGVMAVNLWGGDPHRNLYLDRLRDAFDDQVWWIRPPESSSLVVLCAAEPKFEPVWSRLAQAAQAGDQRWQLGLSKMMDELRDRREPDC